MIDEVIISEEKKVWNILETIMDPEIPVLSIVDLGIVRNVELKVSLAGDTEAAVFITPTYSGCPAMDVIGISIKMALFEIGFSAIEIKNVLSPAWSTEWMTEAGKQKLKAYGITPPHSQQIDTNEFSGNQVVQCPQCNSYNTKLLSYFGSTACKSLYKCEDCLEPFDYFKCH